MCGQVAPLSPGPARPPPAPALPAPLQPRDPPPPSAEPRSRPEAARPRAAESVAPSAGAGALTSRPRCSRAALPSPAVPLTSVEAAALLPGRSGSPPARTRCPPLGFRRAARVSRPPGPRPHPLKAEERSSAERVSLDASSESRLGRGSSGLAKSPQPLCSSDVNQGAKPGPLLTHGHGATPGPRASPRCRRRREPLPPSLKAHTSCGLRPTRPPPESGLEARTQS